MYNMVKCHCCDKMNVKRGLWTAEEDAKMLAYVSKHGTGNWTSIPKKAGLRRCGKSCRLRWTNYLRPDLRHENFTSQEEELIILLHATIGSRWSIIAQQLTGRTDNDVKNYWNTKLKKKLSDMGIDPVTHKSFSQVLADYGSINGDLSKPGPRIGALRNAVTLPKPEPFPVAFGEFNQNITSGTNDGYNNNSIDLLSQLQAIKLVTEASNNQFLNENSSSTKSNSTSTSSSSTRSTAAFENFDSNPDSISSLAFSWKDFLLEDELIPSNLGQEGCDSQEMELVQTQIGHGIGGIEIAVYDGQNFVDSMIDRENEMFSDFADLLEDPPYN